MMMMNKTKMTVEMYKRKKPHDLSWLVVDPINKMIDVFLIDFMIIYCY